MPNKTEPYCAENIPLFPKQPNYGWLRTTRNNLSTTIHTEKSFHNIIKSTRNQIVLTIFRLIWNQTDVRLVQNHSENGKYNLISGWFNKTSKRFLCVYTRKDLSTIIHRPIWQEKGIHFSVCRKRNFIKRKFAHKSKRTI